MCLSDFNSLIELLTGLYFAFFGLQLARTISENKYEVFLSKKDSIRNFIETKSRVPLEKDEWKKFDVIEKYIKKFENHFEKSSEIFEEMFIYSGLFGIIILFISAFYDKSIGLGHIGNTGLFYINVWYIISLCVIYCKLFKNEIKTYSTFKLVQFAVVLLIIFVATIFFSKRMVFNFLDEISTDYFVVLTLFSLLLSYALFYARWKFNTRRLFNEINRINDLVAEFSTTSNSYILRNIK